MLKSFKINLILVSLIIVGAISIFGFANALGTKSVTPPPSCPSYSPPRCSAGQTIIPGTIGANGCQGPATCVSSYTYWYFDNSTSVCQQKQFYGSYMYQGLQTFSTQSACQSALSGSSQSCPIYTPPAPGWCNGGTIVAGKIGTDGCMGIPTCVLPPSQTSFQTPRSASGYAWSDNVGWISFGGNVGSEPPCTPDSLLTQTLSCPSGQTGSITQSRASTCPGPVTTGWTTTSNTCTTPSCVPDSPLTQTLSCPSGQTGSITQSRASTCPGPVTTGWTTTSNTCVASCVPSSEIVTVGCPPGQTGSIKQTQTVTCPGSVVSNQIINNTCVEWVYTCPTAATTGCIGRGVTGASDWYKASSACAAYPTSGGVKPGVTWRLPSIDELMLKYNSLDYKTSWWSGTTAPDDPASAAIMQTGYSQLSYTKKIYTYPFTACVR